MKTPKEKKIEEPNINDIVRKILKESLSICLYTTTENDGYGNNYTRIEVSILLDGEEICKSRDSIH
jgi:hypothetical protein